MPPLVFHSIEHFNPFIKEFLLTKYKDVKQKLEGSLTANWCSSFDIF